MPLLDHFHPPIYPARHWESFHSFWGTALAERLNTTILPAGYFAEAPLQFGTRIEADVATLEERSATSAVTGNGAGGVAVETWAPPAVTATLAAIFPDDIEVQVFQMEAGSRLVGAIELVSPANKDRPETRRAFAAKCAAYLQRGVGLVVADIVTSRHANLHEELMDLLGQTAPLPDGTLMYTTAYRPIHREGTGNQIDVWATPLVLGQELPSMPLALRRGPLVPVELEWAYAEARRRSRL